MPGCCWAPDAVALVPSSSNCVENGCPRDESHGGIRLSIRLRVDSTDHYGNRRQRVERLVSAWNQDSGGVAESVGEPDDPLIGTSAEPRRRARTRLTEDEVDATSSG